MRPMQKPVTAALVVVLASLCRSQPAGPEARARQLLDLLSKNDGAGAAALLDAQLKAAVTADKLHQVWQGLARQMGAFKAFGDARIEASSDADTVFVTCEFEKAKLDAKIPVNKAGLVTGINFGLHIDYTPPDYVKATSFHEKEVTVGSGEWSLHGTLTLPNGTGPFPALILVHGSGSYDRDYSIGPNKLFRDIAWGVASRGVAVLRYNKRSFEHAVAFSKLTSFTVMDEAVDDALLAGALLRKTPEIDAKRIFVLGHSLGGILIPRIGKADPSFAGLIAAAGTPRFLLDLVIPQTIHNFTLNGPMTPANEAVVAKLKQQIARVEDPNLKPDAPASEMPFGISATYWMDLRDYHTGDVARDLKQPMLILQGDRDYQIGAEDFALWRKVLAGRKDVEFKTYPKLNHIFLEGEGVSSDAEYEKPGHVSAAVVEDIAAWIAKH